MTALKAWRQPLVVLLTALATALAGAAPARSQGPTAPDLRPNIVLILADDLGYECLGVNGGESYQTPRLDRMAAEGVRFTRCHSTPLCTPSRVQLMTGRYSFRNYVRFGYLNPDEVTF
ncbi:MAG: sulfatase-like hydrolase/transferase, partial [Planctomycetota bacterium]